MHLPDKSFSVSLLGCKTKMTPMKSTTIPRLELCAAVLLARWMSRIHNAISPLVNIDNIYAWSDSQIVLSWLHNSHTDFKIFVSNRVHQIQQVLPNCKWFYVRTSSNPADCASRGLMPSNLLRNTLYWSGPEILYRDERSWDKPPALTPVNQLPEVKVCALAANVAPTDVEWFSRFSLYKNMLRVVSWIRRFINLCRHCTYSSRFLLPSELKNSLKLIVKCSQRTLFSDLYITLAHGHVPPRTLLHLVHLLMLMI